MIPLLHQPNKRKRTQVVLSIPAWMAQQLFSFVSELLMNLLLDCVLTTGRFPDVTTGQPTFVRYDKKSKSKPDHVLVFETLYAQVRHTEVAQPHWLDHCFQSITPAAACQSHAWGWYAFATRPHIWTWTKNTFSDSSFQTLCTHPTFWDSGMESKEVPHMWHVWYWWYPRWAACPFPVRQSPHEFSP